MYTSREFAKNFGGSWDTALDMEEFLNHNFWDTLTDVTLIYFLGRLNHRRGIDCLNYIIPMFFGACIWELIGKSPELSKNLSNLDAWTTTTYVVFLTFIGFLVVVLFLHGYKMKRDGLLPGRMFEIVLILGLTLGPLIGNPEFHLHHWT